MNLFIVLAMGFGIGLPLGASIYFEKKEPYKFEIMVASTIRNVLVVLLTGFSLTSSWYAGIGFELLCSFAFGVVIFMAKGGFRSKDAPFVVPGAAVAGGLAGLIIVNHGF